MKILVSALLAALLAGCATGPRVDHSYTAKGQASRVKFIVLHYTVSDKPSSIKILTEQQVSAHYLLTDDPQPVVYGLVDETQQAYHAGVSSWKSFTQLNTSSVGIEIVNAGWKDTPQGRVFAPFPQSQIDALIPLVRDIAKRHNVPPENVLGHSDIAPLRKQDPGPLFPWQQLAAAGLVAWPDATRVAAVRPYFDAAVPDVAWFQKKLATHGYAVPQTGVLDEPTRTVLGAFQMKYRPAIIDGTPDAETASLLEVLTTPANAPLPGIVVPPAVTSPVPAVPAAPAAPATPSAPATPPVPATPPAPVTQPAPEAPPVPATPATPPVPVKQ
ncbi:MAG TPA: N-acetylmuramoyl-L-alanine amidase [Telluria sp.]|nr:N-acetylmuramoyl-L-alanine amidase [Telluria sp.]